MNSLLLIFNDFAAPLLASFLFLSHKSDSGIFFLITMTINAGITEIRKASLHPITRATNPPTSAAKINPTGFPV